MCRSLVSSILWAQPRHFRSRVPTRPARTPTASHCHLYLAYEP